MHHNVMKQWKVLWIKSSENGSSVNEQDITFCEF